MIRTVRLTSEKLAQAQALVAASGVDAWITFVRETAENRDPVLPLIFAGGLTWASTLIVTRRGARIAVVGNFDAELVRAGGDWGEIVPYVQSLREPLLEVLERAIEPGPTPPRIAVNFSRDDDKADGLTHGMYLQLVEHLRGTRFENALESAEPIVMALRSRKTPEEVRRMRVAIDATYRLFDAVGAFARVGLSEREIYDFVQREIDARGLGYAWDRAGDPIVNTGPDSAVGHGPVSAEIRIAPGHILHLDLGVLCEGYASDIQRCWYVPRDGERAIPNDVRRALDAVSGAITAGAGALRSGVEGWTVDDVGRRHIVGCGYPEYPHSLGHQVGRVAHDGGTLLGPRWERYGRTPFLKVEPGQVFTLELGVLVEGRGYLGLEEMVRVTEDGCAWMTERQLALPLLAAPARGPGA
jgi:Xaa-Pro aminopeptidase